MANSKPRKYAPRPKMPKTKRRTGTIVKGGTVKRMMTADEYTAAFGTPMPDEIAHLVTPHYATYIASQAWADRRARYMAPRRKRCVACGYKRHLHVHHLSYDNFGREPDDDLMILCRRCHNIVHRFARRNRDMALRVATGIVVGRIRQRQRTALP